MRWVLVVLVLTSLAGCTDRGVEASRDGLHSFTATYRFEGGPEDFTRNVTFDGPYTIADRDLQPRKAWRLTVEDPEATGTYWIDADLRTVRRDRGIDPLCTTEASTECQAAWVAWTNQGRLPPTGLLGLAIVQREGTPVISSVGGAEVIEEVDVRHDRDRTFLTFRDETPEVTFEYDNALAPLERQAGNQTMRRTHLAWGEPLAVADTWPKAMAPLGAKVRDGLFPGWDAPGSAPQQAAKQFYDALADDEVHGHWLDEGCVYGYEFGPEQDDLTTSVHFGVAKGDDSETLRVDRTGTEDVGIRYEVTPSQRIIKPVPCTWLEQGGARIEWEAFTSLVDDIVGAADSGWHGPQHGWALHGGVESPFVEDGNRDHYYSSHSAGQGIVSVEFYAIMNARDGWMNQLFFPARWSDGLEERLIAAGPTPRP